MGRWSAHVELLVNGRPVGVVVATVPARDEAHAVKRITNRTLKALTVSYPKARRVGLSMVSGTVAAR